MIKVPRVELVVASFDDPIVTGLHVERAAEHATRFGCDAGDPEGGDAGDPEGGGDGPGRAPAPVSDAGVVFVVAREPRGLIGCAGLRPLGSDTAEIGLVYVRPEYRGLGVIRLLVEGTERLARERRCRTTRLKVGDLRDVGLYEASGYVRIPPFAPHPPRSVCFQKVLR